jgi:hypothetical protein
MHWNATLRCVNAWVDGRGNRVIRFREETVELCARARAQAYAHMRAGNVQTCACMQITNSLIVPSLLGSYPSYLSNQQKHLCK